MRYVVVPFAALAVAVPAAAGPAFIEATSELDEGKPVTAMWNVVDDNIGTRWCSKTAPSGKEAINFTFDESVVVTHLGIVLPHGKDGTDKAVKRPRVVYVADVDHRVEAKFKDIGGPQTLELTPPARGRRVVVEFAEPWPGATEDAPLCVSEISLRSKNKELTGDIAAEARALNTLARRLLHEWHDDLSAPTRTLLFHVDGTFSYHFTPLLDDQKPAKVKGRWSASGGAVTFDVGGKAWPMQVRLTTVEDQDAHTTELSLTGDAPHPSMVATFRPAPLLLP